MLIGGINILWFIHGRFVCSHTANECLSFNDTSRHKCHSWYQSNKDKTILVSLNVKHSISQKHGTSPEMLLKTKFFIQKSKNVYVFIYKFCISCFSRLSICVHFLLLSHSSHTFLSLLSQFRICKREVLIATWETAGRSDVYSQNL